MQTRKSVSCPSKTRKTNSCSFLRHNVSLFTNRFIRKTIRLCFDCTQLKIAIHCVARNYSCLFSLFLGKILNFKNVVGECFLNFYKLNHNAIYCIISCERIFQTNSSVQSFLCNDKRDMNGLYSSLIQNLIIYRE